MTITDIVNKTYFLTNTTVTSFPAADMLILINNAYERAVSLIMQVDGRWEWDDSNQTDLPIGTATLVDGQQDYSLAVTHLSISRVEILDSSGNYRQITPISESDLRGVALDEFMETDGMPVYYDKRGSSIFLYPAPAAGSVTTAKGLKIFFQRPPALYTSAEVTTGTKVPGFNSLYHDLIPYWVAYDYAMSKGLDAKITPLMNEIARKEDALMSDYQGRSKDENLRIRVVTESSR